MSEVPSRDPPKKRVAEGARWLGDTKRYAIDRNFLWIFRHGPVSSNRAPSIVYGHDDTRNPEA